MAGVETRNSESIREQSSRQEHEMVFALFISRALREIERALQDYHPTFALAGATCETSSEDSWAQLERDNAVWDAADPTDPRYVAMQQEIATFRNTPLSSKRETIEIPSDT
jgi:hypothetical protein